MTFIVNTFDLSDGIFPFVQVTSFTLLLNFSYFSGNYFTQMLQSFFFNSWKLVLFITAKGLSCFDRFPLLDHALCRLLPFFRGLREDLTRKRVANKRTVGQNQDILRYLIIHFPTSSGVSKQASERMSAAERSSKASSVGQANE